MESLLRHVLLFGDCLGPPILHGAWAADLITPRLFCSSKLRARTQRRES